MVVRPETLVRWHRAEHLAMRCAAYTRAAVVIVARIVAESVADHAA